MKWTLRDLCRRAGISRQAVYKARRRRSRREVDAGLVEQLVRAERAAQPRLGGLKLYGMLQPELRSAGVVLGRDLFFAALRSKGLLLEPLPKGPRTTNSAHSLPVFGNRVQDLVLTGPHQAWCADITYLRGADDFYYLSLITDMYSHAVVGYHLSRTIGAADALQALRMALAQKPAGASPIHHSDRGSQYCCHAYVDALVADGLTVSMTETNHCAENALAERLNGILKQEYGLRGVFSTFQTAQRTVEQAVSLYNYRRPHRSLQMRTPMQVHSTAA